jgi:hypothetical protein
MPVIDQILRAKQRWRSASDLEMSIRTIALALGLSAEQLAAFWNQIPLDDFTNRENARLHRQQVINLRRVARDKLGQA